MERPASHHGTLRPDAKNSEVLFPERFAKKSAGTKQTRIVMTAMTQSIQEMFMVGATSRVSGKGCRSVVQEYGLAPVAAPHQLQHLGRGFCE
jgi:hypothetical protein